MSAVELEGVAASFVMKYYALAVADEQTTPAEDGVTWSNFYSASSVLSVGGSGAPTNNVQHKGVDAITKFSKQFFRGTKSTKQLELVAVDVVPAGNGLLISTHGFVRTSVSSHDVAFHQVFQLIATPRRRHTYFVQSEILRYQPAKVEKEKVAPVPAPAPVAVPAVTAATEAPVAAPRKPRVKPARVEPVAEPAQPQPVPEVAAAPTPAPKPAEEAAALLHVANVAGTSPKTAFFNKFQAFGKVVAVEWTGPTSASVAFEQADSVAKAAAAVRAGQIVIHKQLLTVQE